MSKMKTEFEKIGEMILVAGKGFEDIQESLYKPIKFKNQKDREEFFNTNPLICNALKPRERNWLLINGFLTAPASTKYHGAYEGGLFDHSVNVTNALWLLTKNLRLEWENLLSPIRVGMLHDLCKIDQYIKTGAGYEWDGMTWVKGHGTKSVIYAQRVIQLSDEEISCILYHMGAFTDKTEWDSYSRAISLFPNVLWTHTADMIASKIQEV